MGTVRDRYGEIAVMRERGMSWSDIADELTRVGAVTREGRVYPAVTLRSAFFLVTNETRAIRPRPPELPPSLLEPAAEREAVPPDAPFVLAEVVVPAPTVEPPARVVEAGTEDVEPIASAERTAAGEADVSPASTPLDRIVETNGVETPPPGEETDGPVHVVETTPVPRPCDDLFAPAPPGGEDEVAVRPVLEPEEPPRAPAETITESAPIGETTPIPGPFDGLLAPAPPIEETDESASRPDPGVEPEPVRASDASAEKVRLDMPERIAQNAGASVPPTEPVSPSEPLRGHHMLGTIFVLNDRGGVGKTLLSHHLMATAMIEGLQLRVVEYEVNERLARLYGPEIVEHRRITQDFMNLMGSGDGFFEYWDQIGPELQRGGRLFDFGGNISQWFFNWAEVSGFDYYVGEGERLTFMVPVTVDLASLQTGMATLDRVAVIAPKAKRVLVENGISGPFSQLDESQYGRRKAELIEREGVQVVSMPQCTAPAWARLTGHRLDQVAKMTREDLVKLGMTPPVASRSLIIIHEWLRGMRVSLSPFVHEALRASA